MSTFLLCVTINVPPIVGKLGILGHILGSCSHIAAIVVTGVFRYSSEGRKCADFGEPRLIEDDDASDTFKFSDHASVIQGLFITECVLFCCFHFCFDMMTVLELKK